VATDGSRKLIAVTSHLAVRGDSPVVSTPMKVKRRSIFFVLALCCHVPRAL
jgi:hypothetical protein